MTISSSPVGSDLTSSIAPLLFPSNLRLTPDQFALLCAENRDAVLELAADGLPPRGTEFGCSRAQIAEAEGAAGVLIHHLQGG